MSITDDGPVLKWKFRMKKDPCFHNLKTLSIN
jgi:hypothetical protein